MNRRMRCLLASIPLALILSPLSSARPTMAPASRPCAPVSSAASGDARPAFLDPRIQDGISVPDEPLFVMAGLVRTSLMHLAVLGGDRPASAVSWLSRRSPLERRLLVGLLSAAVTLGVEMVGDPSELDSEPTSCPRAPRRVETPCV